MRPNRKDAQLCSQVMRAVGLALAESPDEELSSLTVLAVEPAPHIGHLRVLVASVSGEGDAREIHAKLVARAGALRHEVAGAIHRKKAPTLSFVVVPRPDAPPGP